MSERASWTSAHIARAIERARREMGLTQERFAGRLKELGVTASVDQVGRAERNEIEIPAELLLGAATLAGFSADELLTIANRKRDLEGEGEEDEESLERRVKVLEGHVFRWVAQERAQRTAEERKQATVGE